jgi:phospholipid/cholesterol/gamma-HCH transport system permease protein
MEAAVKDHAEGLDVAVSEKTDRIVVHLAGRLEESDLADAHRVVARLPQVTGRRIEVTLDPQPLKSRGAVILERICRLMESRGAEVVVLPADERMQAALAAHAAPRDRPPKAGDEGLLARAARFQAAVATSTIRYLNLFQDSLATTVRGIFRRRRFDFDDFLLSIVRQGLGAIPLVMLIAGLIGAILALQAGPFFERYGQEHLIAQLVAMSMLREIGPLLTAILVAGRSGSSLAAEIGTMKVSEEVDALVVMGAEPVRVLVAPRLLGLVCALPCLVTIADVVGVLGGMVVGALALGIPVGIWYDQTLKGLEMKDVVGGLVKSVAYAIAIVTISGHQGFMTTGGATGVGRNTTRSVVLSILWIIILDAFITWVIYEMNL